MNPLVDSLAVDDATGAMNRRNVFLAMYMRHRWYTGVDNVVRPDQNSVQQVPDLSTIGPSTGVTRGKVEGW